MKSYPVLVEKLVNDFEVDREAIAPDATLTELGLDSLTLVEFIFEVEDELGVELDMEEAQFETLGEAAELLDRLVAEKKAST